MQKNCAIITALKNRENKKRRQYYGKRKRYGNGFVSYDFDKCTNGKRERARKSRRRRIKNIG